MRQFSTREAAAKLGLTQAALSKYIKLKKIPPPQTFHIGKRIVHAWSEEEIEQVRQLLPKIANGRKTRYKKQQTAKSKKHGAQPRAAVPHKQSKTNKKSKPPRSQSAG